MEVGKELLLEVRDTELTKTAESRENIVNHN